MQKEVRSVAFWKKFCESEAVVVKFMLVVIMTVCMYMFSVVEKVLEKMVWTAQHGRIGTCQEDGRIGPCHKQLGIGTPAERV